LASKKSGTACVARIAMPA
jgi:hypothetical protein